MSQDGSKVAPSNPSSHPKIATRLQQDGRDAPRWTRCLTNRPNVQATRSKPQGPSTVQGARSKVQGPERVGGPPEWFTVLKMLVFPWFYKRFATRHLLRFMRLAQTLRWRIFGIRNRLTVRLACVCKHFAKRHNPDMV